jgi:hypothetical protein
MTHEPGAGPHRGRSGIAGTGWAAVLSGREPATRRRLMFDAGSASFEDALGAHLAGL